MLVSKNRGMFHPKMDGEKKWKNPIKSIKMDDLGVKPTIFGNTHIPFPWIFFLVFYWDGPMEVI